MGQFGHYAERFAPLREVFLAVLRRDPSATVQQQVLVATILFLLVLFVVAILLLFLTPTKKRVLVRRRPILRSEVSTEVSHSAVVVEMPVSPTHETASSAPGPVPRSAWRRIGELLVGAPMLVLIVVLFAVATYGTTGTNAYCTYACHQDFVSGPVEVDAAPMLATEASPTVSVDIPTDAGTYHARCASCHRAGIVAAVTDQARMIYVSIAGSSESSSSAIVSSASCLRCHSDVLDGVLIGSGGNVRMSHREPHDAGKSCTMCHQRISHTRARTPDMSSCLDCHDSVQASAECHSCHLANPSDRSTRDKPQGVENRRVYALVELRSDRCYDCHAPQPCDSCHGVRLPHTPEFLTGRHARDAAWDRKQMCYRCHTVVSCQRCHLSFAVSHYDGWEQDHVTVDPSEARCGCHDRRWPARTEPFCTVCHW